MARSPFAGKTNIAALQDVVKKAPALHRLVMSGCGFDRESWLGLCKGLVQSKTLYRLELDQINLAKCNLQDLKEALQQVFLLFVICGFFFLKSLF